MRALDLFAGARGWSLGGQMVGIEDEGVEIMPAANATAEAAGFKVVHNDVWTFPLHMLDRYDGQITSPPCQTFSLSGKGSGRKALNDVLSLMPMVEMLSLEHLRLMGKKFGDDRTALVLTPLWYALNAPGRTRWLAWEQVPAVLPVWEACAVVLREHGWNVWTGYLHSEQYGVGQTRKRAFLMASKDHEVRPPRPTHSRYYPTNPAKLDSGVLKWRSMADVLGLGDSDGAPAKWMPDGTERFAQQSDNEPDYEWPFNRPATVVAGRGMVGAPGATANRFNGSTKSRNDGVRVTVQEAGVLQSFPADHPWQGSQSDRYLQAGNAVPPLVARAVLQEVAYGVI